MSFRQMRDWKRTFAFPTMRRRHGLRPQFTGCDRAYQAHPLRSEEESTGRRWNALRIRLDSLRWQRRSRRKWASISRKAQRAGRPTVTLLPRLAFRLLTVSVRSVAARILSTNTWRWTRFPNERL